MSSRWEQDTPFWLLRLGSGIRLRRQGPGGGEGSGRGPELPLRPAPVQSEGLAGAGPAWGWRRLAAPRPAQSAGWRGCSRDAGGV